MLAATAAQAYSALYVFGDSLSDAGNNAIAFDQVPATAGLRTPVPLAPSALIPTFPYDTSALAPTITLDRYTNGAVWAEIFARALGLPGGGVASLAGGTNFAFGGATTGTGAFGSAAVPSLLQQVTGLLQKTGNVADPEALYVVAGGGNNARNAVNAIAAGGAPTIATIEAAGKQYAADTLAMVNALQGAGARNIVVWNIPDIGLAPALALQGQDAKLLGSAVASGMNGIMQQTVWSRPGVLSFDLYALVDDVVANPGRYGLTDVTSPCAALPRCNAATTLFWDGIHPSAAGHQVIASAMIARVPEPLTLILLAIAGVVLIALRFGSRR
jgi:outer membrane lipase/esterase